MPQTSPMSWTMISLMFIAMTFVMMSSKNIKEKSSILMASKKLKNLKKWVW